MKEIKNTWCIQIDVTNKCENKCSNCTHLTTLGKKWEMSLEEIEQAIDSLEGYKGVIGVIGGNPCLHTQVTEIAELFKRKIKDKSRRGFWTSNFFGHESLIREVFGYINYNPHAEAVEHSPVLVSSQWAIEDEATRKKVIDKCWLAEKWSPGINPKGAFRCEVQAAMDMQLGGNLGLPVEKGWWKIPMSDERIQKQIDTYCNKCGVCLNLKGRPDKEQINDISPDNSDMFAGINMDRINVVDKSILGEKEKEPWRYIVKMKSRR